MAQNNRYLSGYDLLKKAAGAKQSTENTLQALGRKAKERYDTAWKRWEGSAAYKKAQQRAKYEG